MITASADFRNAYGVRSANVELSSLGGGGSDKG